MQKHNAFLYIAWNNNARIGMKSKNTCMFLKQYMGLWKSMEISSKDVYIHVELIGNHDIDLSY